MLDKTYRQVDRSTSGINFYYDIFVIEICVGESKFIFKYNKNPGKLGKCESCYQTTILTTKCPCENVFYCSPQCKKKDERYHKSTCEYENKLDEEKLNNMTFE